MRFLVLLCCSLPRVSPSIQGTTGIMGVLVAIAALASALPPAFAQANPAPTIAQEAVPSLQEFTAGNVDGGFGEATALQSPVVNERDRVQFRFVDPHPKFLSLEEMGFEGDPLPFVVSTQESWLGQAGPDVLETTPEGEDTAPLRINVTGEILDQPVFTPFRRKAPCGNPANRCTSLTVSRWKPRESAR
jgi:hypothetical protein